MKTFKIKKLRKELNFMRTEKTREKFLTALMSIFDNFPYQLNIVDKWRRSQVTSIVDDRFEVYDVKDL